MHTFTRPDNASDLRSLSSGIDTSGYEVESGSDGTRVSGRFSENLSDIASGFTLDDFGGRSDALGG